MVTMTRSSEPAALLRQRCEAMIEAELARLARRSTLDGAALAAVGRTLRAVADYLLLDRVGDATAELAVLFDLEKAC